MNGRRSPWPTIVTVVSVLVTIVCIAVPVAAYVFGLRPVVITTGSMGEAAPAGSMAIAGPRSTADIEVGDMLVMRRAGTATITHRVIAIEQGPSGLLAITQGDANPAPDPAPYRLGDDELVVHRVVPGVGSYLTALRDPRLLLGLVAATLLVATVAALRRIWSDPDRDSHDDSNDGPLQPLPLRSDPPPSSGRLPPPLPSATPATTAVPVEARPTSHRTRVSVAVALASLVAVVGAGVVFSLHSASAVADSNVFDTAACFGARVSSVQSGETVHATNGVLTEPITAVDPARSFVLASVRSNSNEVADSSAQVTLASGTSIELRRATDDGAPPAVSVAWSVVEYSCGVSVQRGLATGDGTDEIDVTIGSVDPGASFVLVDAAFPAAAADFGPEQLYAGELVGPTTLRIRGAGSAAFPADQSFAWQVASFDDPDDVVVQTATSTLGVGVAADTITLGAPADVDASVVLAAVTSDATGPDIGERLVRAHLADPTTVVVERSVAGDPVDVHVQVITLRDGTVVRHGTIDLAAGTAADTIAVPAVDTGRATVISTVGVPGPVAGGMSDHVADDVVGEASATFVVSDPTTVTVARDSVASNASFGWQLVEWGGPGWWDPAYGYRRRIDIATASAAAPDGYTVPLVVDHAALISSGIARADGDDLRVVRWDGTAWTELDRVLDDDDAWAQSDTTIWFRTTDAIAAGSTDTYWLYLHNPAAGPPPNDPEAVYELVEDFDAGGLGDFEDRTGGTGWYGAAPWTRRIPLTVPAGQVAADLADFPLLVSLTSADLGANAQPDGSDIRFTAADGTTPLAHDVERFDAGSGAIDAWVRVPTLAAATPTTIYLYYGAADAPAQDDIHGTWTDEFEAVWHLARDPAGSAPQFDDASSRNHDGLSVGAMTLTDLQPARVGAGLDLDGSDDGLQADHVELASSFGLTVSAWVRPDVLTAGARIFSKADSAIDRQVDLLVEADGTVEARLRLETGEVVATTSPGVVTAGGWHHVALTWDRTALRVLVDGGVAASTPTRGSIESRPTMAVHVGNIATQDAGFDGLVDEVRLETTARSTAWLAAAEANQRTPATFVGAGTVESGSWFDQGTWARRKPIVVDSSLVPSDLVDFPLLVEVTDAALQASAQACACDLVFTGADGTTRLDHAIEAYDSATGALTAWVSVPVLSGTEDTELFLYYGNPTAVDQQDPRAVVGSDADLQTLGTP